MKISKAEALEQIRKAYKVGIARGEHHRPHGEWKFREVQIARGGTSFGYVCSVCGKDYWQTDGFNFCPSCGADMRGNNDSKL